MKKLFKKLATLAMAAVMMVGVGAAAFAVNVDMPGTYTATTTLYKEQACENVSMGNSGIQSVSVSYVAAEDDDGNIITDAEGNTVYVANITLVSKEVFYNSEKGQLDSFALFDAAGNRYDGEKNGKTFTIYGFPADQFQVGSVLQGEFTSYVSIMGTRTGYLKVQGLA